MFAQITKEKFIRQKDIIGAFDLDTSTVSGVTKNFLGRAEKNSKTIGTGSLPRSFVLAGGKDFKAYFSANTTGYIDKSAHYAFINSQKTQAVDKRQS